MAPQVFLLLLGALIVVQGQAPLELLPKTVKGQVFVCEYQNANGSPVVLARSYDAKNWERVGGIYTNLANVTCNSTGCYIQTYKEHSIRSINVPAELKTPALLPVDTIARLHQQATFGATKAQLDAFYTKYAVNFGQWIQDQFKLTPTLTRTYYRQRTHSRPGNYSVGANQTFCDIGSRWHSYVFEIRDRQLDVVVSKVSANSRFALKIKGSLRGEVTSFLGQAYPGTALNLTFPATFYICTVDETFNGTVTLSIDGGAHCNYTWTNPLIDFNSTKVGQLLGASDAVIAVPAGARLGAYYLASRAVACNTTIDINGNAFIRQGNNTYRWDKRLLLLENTLEQPANVPANFTGTCPVVPQTYQNRDFCVRRVGCGEVDVCGSQSEVASTPSAGAHYAIYNYMQKYSTAELEYLEHPLPYGWDRIFAVNNLALKATDQLRHRVAWALANIFTLGSDIDKPDFTDSWLTYYDIFVRNAFGTFINILRDVSYHPLMGNYLTYVSNKAYAVQNTYPDENYAREVMQLFSVGLWKLNDDGTQQLDANGNPLATYTNADILDHARHWTGFERQSSRTNFGAANYEFGPPGNYHDPMKITAKYRDRFPKTKLDSGFLGDWLPLCEELPSKHFLQIGARYEFTGNTSIEGSVLDVMNTSIVGTRQRFTPAQAGSPYLYYYLCIPRANGTCTFPPRVILPRTVTCRGTQECNALDVKVVKIVDPIANVTRYYNYIPPPCVRLTFFNGGQLIKRASTVQQCADPATRVGSPVCCKTTDLTKAVTNYTSECLYLNEVVDFATNQQRCAALNLTSCGAGLVSSATFANTCAQSAYMWTNGTCTVQMQVYPSGQVGIIDPVAPQLKHLLVNSNNVFRVRWNSNLYPQYNATVSSCPTACVPQNTTLGFSCVCNFTVTQSSVYTLATLNALTTSNVASSISSRCTIGSQLPSSYGTGIYLACNSTECVKFNTSNVFVWLHKDDAAGVLSVKTIFQLPPVRVGGKTRYVFNRQSVVKVGSAYSFRNPPVIPPLLGATTDSTQSYFTDNVWARRAEQETEELLTHLSEHQSNAPFIVYRLIQHLVTSNPSPGYVKRVVTAYRNGTYSNFTFSGKNGDLGAAVFAILMDQEARSPVLEAEPSFGQLRDPLVKVFQFMKSLGYSAQRGRELMISSLGSATGVQVFSSSSVFGFYLPEYSPSGPLLEAGLVSPQSQLATTPNVFGYLNGLTSLVDNGLTSCDYGLAVSTQWGGRKCGNSVGQPQASDGFLNYNPAVGLTPAQIVDEVNLVLTARRLNSATREMLVKEYNTTLAASANNSSKALKQVLDLVATSSEYQTNSFNILTNTARTPPVQVPSGGRPFKAVIVLFEYGGFDSFNLIVPHSNCPAKDLYAEYQTVRGGAALNKTDVLQVNVTSSQPCKTFGIHPALPNIRDLYNGGDVAFLANIGSLVEPVTKEEYNKGTKRLPPSLFAHNIMQRNVQNVWAQELSAEGVLARITETLIDSVKPAYKSQIYSFGGNTKMVQGSVPADFISGGGSVVPLRGLSKFQNGINNITQYHSASLFAETYANALYSSINKTQVLSGLLTNTTLNTTFGTSSLDLQFQTIAKLIKTLPASQQVERAVFFTQTGGFDTHSTFDLAPILAPINSAVGNFAKEMKFQGKWNDVVIITASDFARTLYANGAGTDHAWGGNHFMAGGKVKAGQMFGTYPPTLTDDYELSLGRGRLIPSLPFEAPWKAICEWFGVPSNKTNSVLPNVPLFPASQLLSASQVFDP